MTKKFAYRSGFTLIELSVVLAIFGLLVGGILGGQGLLRTAEVSKLGIEAQQYQNATLAFMKQYNGVPGDFATATSYWGLNSGIAAGGGASDCSNQADYVTEKTTTCNGNGNRQISDNYLVTQTGSAAAVARTMERFSYWRHLANAGFIKGNYYGIKFVSVNGTECVGTNVCTVNIKKDTVKGNVPSAALGGTASCWTAQYWNQPSGLTGHVSWGSVFPIIGTWLVTGNLNANDRRDGCGKAPSLTTDEAFSVDRKTDDGKPGLGQIISTMDTSCATSTATSASYNTTTGGKVCSLYFKIF